MTLREAALGVLCCEERNYVTERIKPGSHLRNSNNPGYYDVRNVPFGKDNMDVYFSVVSKSLSITVRFGYTPPMEPKQFKYTYEEISRELLRQALLEEGTPW